MILPMKTALLVTGGSAPPFASIQALLADCRLVCAADSGLDTLRSWGVEPDLVVGDFDSLSDPSILADYPAAIRYPMDKDETDTELGIRELRERGCEHIILAGGGGGRLDHVLAIRALFERPSGPDEWLTHGERLVRIHTPRCFKLKPGSLVSIFPLAAGARGMVSSGLKWPLAGLSWGPGDFGVSNLALEAIIEIVPGDGALIVVLPL
jgi:thiamine pyrophosphokinase